MEFKKSVEAEIEIKLKEEERKKLYENQLKEYYDGPLYRTVGNLFKTIIGVNIIVPGDFEN